MWEAIIKMGEQLWELIEKGIDSKGGWKKKRNQLPWVFPRSRNRMYLPKKLSCATPSFSVATPKPPTTHPYYSFPPIPDVEGGNVKDFVMFSLPRIVARIEVGK